MNDNSYRDAIGHKHILPILYLAASKAMNIKKTVLMTWHATRSQMKSWQKRKDEQRYLRSLRKEGASSRDVNPFPRFLSKAKETEDPFTKFLILLDIYAEQIIKWKLLSKQIWIQISSLPLSHYKGRNSFFFPRYAYMSNSKANLGSNNYIKIVSLIYAAKT